ncbi:MAG: hypothetical protein M3N16_06630, partial [Actinomycetota bacterium]|nr:hypothetical protein [Actinomycetota bacterium]
RTVARTRTRGDGTFSALAAPPGRRLLRASFSGGASGRPATSASLLVRVRAALTARANAAVVAVGEKAVVGGTVGPAKPRVAVIVERRVNGRYRRVATLRARAAAGRYTKGYRPRSPGVYRFRAVFGGDRQNLAGRSGFAVVRAVAQTGGASPAYGR